MTASFQPSVAPARGPSAAASVAIVLVASVAVLGLFLAGVTFIGLAIAFPIAIPVAAHYHVAVSASDMAIVEQFAPFGWLFGGLAIASLIAALVVAIKALQALSPVDRD